ncbi:MAG: SDR family NAD(P)-dependent oxidoreductase [Verrucomicrobiota bacterium]
MHKTILITGATDGIGLATAQQLAADGHHLLLHGRNSDKLAKVAQSLVSQTQVESYIADFSRIEEVDTLAQSIKARHEDLDVLINNAGILKTRETITKDGLDVRFVVNTISPYNLTRKLLPLIGKEGRVINLSSAAQSPVDLRAFVGSHRLDDMSAYAQSKLALTMWSRHLALAHPMGPVFVAVNPASLLASKMVKESFGVAGNDLSIGADILVRAALSDEFSDASGKYYDNDAKRFAELHPDATNPQKIDQLIQAIESITS